MYLKSHIYYCYYIQKKRSKNKNYFYSVKEWMPNIEKGILNGMFKFN